ncbi:MAG: 6-phosphogluconolactonase [Proteobacteria bacterium]|nr:6-phosphogluconolactonase [Pseudomonadota bacterium]
MTPVVQVLPGTAAVAEAAAAAVAAAITQARARRGRALLALSGGETPRRTYARLAADPYRTSVPWSDTQVFWSDERCVPATDPASNFGMANTALLSRLSAIGGVHPVRGDLGADAAAADYDRLLRSFGDSGRPPRLDLILLGVGADGHTASLFPGGEAGAPGALAATSIAPQPPISRVTMTLPVLNAARAILFVVTGANKRPALTRILGTPPDLSLPAAQVRPSAGRVTWMLDRDAAPAN